MSPKPPLAVEDGAAAPPRAHDRVLKRFGRWPLWWTLAAAGAISLGLWALILALITLATAPTP